MKIYEHIQPYVDSCCRLKIVLPFILSVITFICYFPSLTYGFIFDDLPTIVEYFHIRTFDPIGQFFSNSRWVSRLLNQFTYRYWNTNPVAYRVIDLFIHIAIGVMIFFVVYKTFSTLTKNNWLKSNVYWIATLTSALFLLHPVQTQTATYITQMRLEGLVVFFVFAVLLTFICAVKSQNKNHRLIFYFISFVLAAFGVGTKEGYVVLPVLLALFDWFFLAEGDWAVFKKRLFIHGVYFFIVLSLLAYFGIFKIHYIKTVSLTPLANNRGNILTSGVQEKITLPLYALSQFKIILHYISIFVWPSKIAFDYGMKLSRSLFDTDVWLPLLGLLLMIGGALWLLTKKSTHIISFCFGWFLIAIAPRASIFPSTELVCDYKTYLSSFGAVLLLAVAFVYGVQKVIELLAVQKKEACKLVVTSLFILCSGFATKSRNQVWSSDLAFWEDAVKKCPKARLYNNLGTSLLQRNKRVEAIEAFNTAIKYDDFYAEPHVNLGVVLHRLGKRNEAFQHYKRAVEIGEMHPELYLNFGLLHMDMKSFHAAELCFKTALQLKPYYTKAYTSLGQLYHIQNKKEEAIRAFEQALQGHHPGREEYYLYATSLSECGALDKAIEYFEKIDKNFQNTAFLLGCCYYQKQQYAKAAENFGIAAQQKPDDIIVGYNYAQSLINIRRFNEALPYFEKCKNDPKGEYPYAGLHVAKCLLEIGKKDEARRQLQQLISSAKYEHVKNDGITLMREVESA